MLPVGFAVLWGGYALASWGYLLVKGYNVTLRQWVSPLNPYTGKWPPDKIPAGSLWPVSTGPGALAFGLEAGVNANALAADRQAAAGENQLIT